MKLRLRLKYGVKEELLSLLKLKGVGRVRARKLYNGRVRNLADVKRISLESLIQILSSKIALDIKKQVGQDFEKIKIKVNKRKGQINLNDFTKEKNK